MCTCASCSYTDSFSGFGLNASKGGFANWPRGEPAGPRRSAADYAAHVRYGLQWGRGYDGVMHERKECTVSTAGTRASPERLVIPKARWEQVGYHRSERKWIEAPETMAEYIAQFERLNGLKRQEPVKAPARPRTPAKAREHFPALDRQREAINDSGKSATILYMVKPKPKRSRGRPAVPGRFVVVKLDERLIAKALKLGMRPGKKAKVALGIRKALERVRVA